MTIKVSKPAINIREKLNDLDFDKVPFQKMPAGSVVQVVQGTTTTYTANSSATFADTTLTATISPSSSKSKILVLIDQQGCRAAAAQTGDITMKLQRDSSDIYKFALGYWYTSVSTEFRGGISGTYLDSPNSTVATVYKTVFAPNDGGTSTVQNDNANTMSTITLMEIAQ
jgi:hypothetical protein